MCADEQAEATVAIPRFSAKEIRTIQLSWSVAFSLARHTSTFFPRVCYLPHEASALQKESKSKEASNRKAGGESSKRPARPSGRASGDCALAAGSLRRGEPSTAASGLLAGAARPTEAPEDAERTAACKRGAAAAAAAPAEAARRFKRAPTASNDTAPKRSRPQSRAAAASSGDNPAALGRKRGRSAPSAPA